MIQPSTARFELFRRNARAYVRRKSDGQIVAALSKAEATVLWLLANYDAPEDAEFILRAAVGDASLQYLQRVRARLSPLLSPYAGISCRSSLEAFESTLPPEPEEGWRPIPGPRVLHWCVTKYCPRRCIYCYAEPTLGSKAEDSVLSRADLLRVFQEAAILGAKTFLVGGSEPFLRRDLPEIMGDAQSCGITPLVTTKHYITQDIAKKLADAGVAHISLSLDTLDPDQSRTLIGHSHYPAQVRQSVANLKAVGVRFSMQCVVTSLNEESAREVAHFAEESGAVVLQIVPFEPVRRPLGHYSNHEMLVRDHMRLEKLVAEMTAACSNVKVEQFQKLGSGSHSAFNCDIGMTKLFFLPNGLVHRCYKLVDDHTLQGRDLRTCSVAAAWHDPGFLRKISPSRHNYSESSCNGCGRFSNCHDEGRCVYQASIDHGTYFAPDRKCGGPFASASSPSSSLVSISLANS